MMPKCTYKNFLLAAGDSGGVNVGELVRVVREAALSRTEIQILTDALLNKHHDPLPEHSEWTEVYSDLIFTIFMCELHRLGLQTRI